MSPRSSLRRPLGAAAGGSALLAALALVAGPPPPLAEASERPVLGLVSARPDGAPGNAQSGTFGLGVSADGSTVAFTSLATDLDPRDTDRVLDVYVARNGAAPELVSTTAEGVKGDAISTRPEVSADGRFVTFMSAATNLDPLSARSYAVYVKDLESGELVLASTSVDGTPANGTSSLPVLSADGRYVAFASRADNLHPHDGDTLPDAYVKDLHTGELHLVSITEDGVKAQPGYFGIGPVAISGDGTHVAFATDASGLDPEDADTTADVFVKDWLSGELIPVTPGSAPGGSSSPSLSHSGHQVAFETYRTDFDPLDKDEESSVYVRDIDTGELVLASVLPDGRGVGYRATQPSLSGDGRTVAFASNARTLGPGDAIKQLQVFVRSLDSDTAVLASVDPAGQPATFLAIDPALAGDGRSVVFATPAALVPADVNGWADVYQADLAGDVVPQEPHLAAQVSTSELDIGGIAHTVVSVEVTAGHPSGITEVVTRISDATRLVQAVQRTPVDGATTLARTDHFVVPRGSDPRGWRVRVLVETEDGDVLRARADVPL